jgi:hypothetical protein
MNSMTERLDLCEDFSDVFELVKKSAERALGRRRAGLMLYLATLPKQVGAFHALGTNGIVMNRSILLHEYLHALGYVQERDVRKLVYDISLETYGPNHPATQIASKGPSVVFPDLVLNELPSQTQDIEMIPDLEGSSKRYIS